MNLILRLKYDPPHISYVSRRIIAQAESGNILQADSENLNSYITKIYLYILNKFREVHQLILIIHRIS